MAFNLPLTELAVPVVQKPAVDLIAPLKPKQRYVPTAKGKGVVEVLPTEKPQAVTSFVYPVQTPSSRTNQVIVAIFSFKNHFLSAEPFNAYKAMQLLDVPIVLDRDIVSVDVTASKASHISMCNVAFKDQDSISEIVNPGDWLMVWMLDNIEDAERIRGAIVNGAPCNAFNDGLKFLGRLTAVSKNVTIDVNGMKSKSSVIGGTGFLELDSSVYFDPALKIDENENMWFARLRSGMGRINASAQLQTNAIINDMVSIFLGGGPNPEVRLSKVMPATPNSMFLIPNMIANLTNNPLKDPDSDSFTYSALLRTLSGIQKYVGAKSSAEWSGFHPELSGTAPHKSNRWFCPTPVSGEMAPQVQAWPGVPIWSILYSFLNPAMNELYTCLRVDLNGFVQPTLVLRQIPFNTERRSGAGNTQFLNLPRWGIETGSLLSISVGKSNSMKCNFVQIRNQSPLAPAEQAEALQRARVFPVAIGNDIIRNGLYPVLKTTNTMPPSIAQGGLYDTANAWTASTADRMVPLYARWSGQIMVKGIQAPICQGDNVQIGDTVYHIEQVSHRAATAPNGMISWETSLAVSNGVPVVARATTVEDLSSVSRVT